MLPIDIIIPTNKGIDEVAEYNIIGWVISDIDYKGNANVKRNYGATKGTQPYLFFMDDDVTLQPGILMKMCGKLIENPTKGYCYCDFIALNHPCNDDFVHRAGEFSAERLRSGNYISTMSLIKRTAFEAVGGFDEKIERLQDADLWLSMLKIGVEGIYLPEIGFITQYSKNGVTQKEGYKEAWEILRRKHGL